MRGYAHINSAIAILRLYDGTMPFASFIKTFFSQHKKYGSKDRRQIAHLCYCYFRLGKQAMNVATEEKMLTALFLCSGESNEILAAIQPDWNKKVAQLVSQKLLALNYQLSSIFPFASDLSNEIDEEKFIASFFIQPDLFLRSRPGKKEKIIKTLTDAGVALTLPKADCIQLNNGTKVEQLLEIDKEIVVQDFNSQQVFDQIPQLLFNNRIKVWDCCAASGGKSILLFDKNQQIQLTVTDVRESILANLKKRFAIAGIKNYKSFIADLSKKEFKDSFLQKGEGFDFIICDAPCSGSGTWSRTPEQLVFFKKEKIDYYANLQKKIVLNAAKSLKTGGYFLYITCSVFKKENEEVVSFIQTNTELQLQSMQYFKGYDKKADTLFAALFQL